MATSAAVASNTHSGQYFMAKRSNKDNLQDHYLILPGQYMSTDFPINITQIERFSAFLLISGNLLLVSLLKTKNHKFGIGPWKNSLKKEKT